MPSGSFTITPARAAVAARPAGTPAKKGYFVVGNKGSLGFVADPRYPNVLTYLSIGADSKTKIKREAGDTISTAKPADWRKVGSGTVNLTIRLP